MGVAKTQATPIHVPVKLNNIEAGSAACKRFLLLLLVHYCNNNFISRLFFFHTVYINMPVPVY